MKGYILSIGRINLKTGSSKYFNIYETWGEDTTYEIHELYMMGHSEPSYRIIVTSGKAPLVKDNEECMYFGDQSRRFLFRSKMVDFAVGNDLKKLAEKYGSKIRGFTYK